MAKRGLPWLGFDCLGSAAVGSMGVSVASVQICLASIWGLAPVLNNNFLLMEYLLSRALY